MFRLRSRYSSAAAAASSSSNLDGAVVPTSDMLLKSSSLTVGRSMFLSVGSMPSARRRAPSSLNLVRSPVRSRTASTLSRAFTKAS